jgi:mono/diheme cytochrome c family protein
LAELDRKYSTQGVAFLAVNSNQQDSLAELAHHARVHELNFPVLKDPGNVVADQFDAERTPEVFVLDSDRIIRYRGRIDDQYTYGKQRSKANRADLATALDELLSGKPVSVPQTEVDGCHIGRVLKSQEQSDVTYSQQISRIFQKRCVECHRPGEIAPFSLTSYDDAAGWAEMIDEVVREQRMPPWNANPDHGTFINDARLTGEEKQLISQWVRDGAPEGDSSELPPQPNFVEGWRIGQPDQVLYMSETPFNVPATGEVKYQYFVVDPGFNEDKWIQAAECRPDNRLVVHHIIVAVKPPSGDANADLHGLSSQWLAATAPGARPLILPEGMAKFVPAGSKLVFQMHYTPNGAPQTDRSSVGLIFADAAKVHKQVATQQASNRWFRIPANADNYEVSATYRFNKDSLMLAMFPHMHLRGKSFRYTAKYPDGSEEVLLDVPQYDFNWQNSYEFTEPKLMPAKTVLECVAHFDNSEFNLANPDPNVTVTWGDQTWEEMMIGYFDMALADQDLAKEGQAARQKPATMSKESVPQLPNGAFRLDPQIIRHAVRSRNSDEAWKRFAEDLGEALAR